MASMSVPSVAPARAVTGSPVEAGPGIGKRERVHRQMRGRCRIGRGALGRDPGGGTGAAEDRAAGGGGRGHRPGGEGQGRPHPGPSGGRTGHRQARRPFPGHAPSAQVGQQHAKFLRGACQGLAPMPGQMPMPPQGKTLGFDLRKIAVVEFQLHRPAR